MKNYKYFLLGLFSLTVPLVFFKQSVDFSKSKKTIADSSIVLASLRYQLALKDTIIHFIRDSNYSKQIVEVENKTNSKILESLSEIKQLINSNKQDFPIEQINQKIQELNNSFQDKILPLAIENERYKLRLKDDSIRRINLTNDFNSELPMIQSELNAILYTLQNDSTLSKKYSNVQIQFRDAIDRLNNLGKLVRRQNN